ncbi:MAG: NADP-dependent oxidoreductase [Gammaproteobacteria bacterium]|nr:NADP-dependent oxidoreductase [Gammaproteobacteria bacterium]
MKSKNLKVILTSRPVGEATSECFSIIEEDLTALSPGEVRIANESLSVDAAIRTMLRGEGFHMQMGIGDTIFAGGVGRIVESTVDGWDVGRAVRGPLGAQSFAALSTEHLELIEESNLPLSVNLGILGGSTGVTAWIGVKKVARPNPGDLFVVSAAAGAVGSIAGQIAQKEGAKVIGIAGGKRKISHLLNDLKFEAAIDYKSEDVRAKLAELAPNGVNGFFDNVGGDILDAVLENLALRSRVTICGAVSQYNDMDHVQGPSSYLKLAERQSAMEGFAYFHYPEFIKPAEEELRQWLHEGSIKLAEEVIDGIEKFPEALAFMFSGGNLGKLLVKVR